MLSQMTSTLKTTRAILGTDPSERRRYPRYPFTATLEAFEPESQTRIQGRTADLSEGGCYVDTMSPFPPKTRLNIRITREKRSFEGQATVMYSVTGMGMGLRFEVTDSRQLSTLKRWLGESSGESASEAELEQTAKPLPAQPVDTRHILNDLVRELLRKGVLTEELGHSMLERLA